MSENKMPLSMILSACVSIVATLLLVLLILLAIIPTAYNMLITLIEIFGIIIFVLIAAYFFVAIAIEKRI